MTDLFASLKECPDCGLLRFIAGALCGYPWILMLVIRMECREQKEARVE